jgi:hypothetical protein
VKGLTKFITYYDEKLSEKLQELPNGETEAFSYFERVVAHLSQQMCDAQVHPGFRFHEESSQ